MASSSGSLDTSANSYPNFTFSAHPFMTTSFSDLLASGTDEGHTAGAGDDGRRGLSDRIAERTGWGVPKFKSLPPPSLPISPPSVSPSSYFAIPAGLSPAELLDSPVLLNSSNVSIHELGFVVSWFWVMGFFFLFLEKVLKVEKVGIFMVWILNQVKESKFLGFTFFFFLFWDGGLTISSVLGLVHFCFQNWD